MYREIVEKLALWKKKADKQPLLITGAKAVGKSTAVKEFGEKYYKKLILVDLEKDRDNFIHKGVLLRKKFDEEVIKYIGSDEKKEDILIVFDHFNIEKVREYTAADIIRFIVYNLMDYNICLITSFRIQKLCLAPGLLKKLDIYSVQPVSLKEFFIINNDRALLEAVENNAGKELPPEMLEKIRLYIKVYFITGGMPKVVQTYMDTRNLEKVNHARIQMYQTCLKEINSIPDLKFRAKVHRIYSDVAARLDSPEKSFQYGISAYFTGINEWHKALEWLEDRQMVLKTEALKEVKMPLQENKKSKGFRLYYQDIGMLTYAYNIQFADLVKTAYPYELRHRALLEQFVLQQLLVSGIKGMPYCWSGNEKEGVEFVCENENEIIPIKIGCKEDAGKVINEYREKYHPNLFVAVTNDTIDMAEPVVKIPSFAVWNL